MSFGFPNLELMLQICFDSSMYLIIFHTGKTAHLTKEEKDHLSLISIPDTVKENMLGTNKQSGNMQDFFSLNKSNIPDQTH